MEEEEGGIKLSKRFSDKSGPGEVDYKTKAGTAWSHNYLNQKPWHPLSYRNQRRKWIAEQTHAQHERRAEEVAREYVQEQEFFRQTAMISKKEREKVEMMKAVSFMYVRPPGYNAESAKAAEVADERRKEDQNNTLQDQLSTGSVAIPSESAPKKGGQGEERKKPRPKDVFGRSVPTEEEFAILKNAPRLETGAPARVKPFAVEVRNVKCLRCGAHGHQSGDRECPLKDVIMPNEESRLKRDDPLTAITAHTDPSEPLKWELKQKPGLSPPRGGFNPDDPNQQIVAEDIFDEYGGFLCGDSIPDLFANLDPGEFIKKKSRKGKKHQRDSSKADDLKMKKRKRKKQDYNVSDFSEASGSGETASDSSSRRKSRRQKQLDTREDNRRRCMNSGERMKSGDRRYSVSNHSDERGNCRNKDRDGRSSFPSEHAYHRRSRIKRRNHKRSNSSEDSDCDYNRVRKSWHKSSTEKHADKKQRCEKRRRERFSSSEDLDYSDSEGRETRQKHSHSFKHGSIRRERKGESQQSLSEEEFGFDGYRSCKGKVPSYSSGYENDRHNQRSNRREEKVPRAI